MKSFKYIEKHREQYNDHLYPSLHLTNVHILVHVPHLLFFTQDLLAGIPRIGVSSMCI